MTKTKGRSTEDVRAELGQAEAALVRLAEEENGSAAGLKRAADASRGAWQEAAMTGEPLAAGSEFARHTARTEELPGLVWAARLRVLELRAELREVGREEEKRAEAEASATAEELRPRFERLRDELRGAENDASAHRAEARELNREAGEIRREIAALEARGPDAPKGRGSLLPRPKVFGGAS